MTPLPKKSARIFEGSDIQLIRDIPFLGPDRAEKMDAYLPAERFRRPSSAILLIHGGGWRIGDKADEREINIGNHLAAAGHAVFSINYLLNQGSPGPDGAMALTRIAWPQNLHDCQSALRYLKQQAEKFGIDPERIAVMGGSAGGSFALLLGCASGNEGPRPGGLYQEKDNRVACVIDLYGPTDMQNHRLPIFAGKTEAETLQNAREASPVTWLHQEMPPVLIVHGTGDKIVPVEDSRNLARKLDQLGAEYGYMEIAGAPHTFHLEPAEMDLKPLVLSFLAKHLGQPISD